MATSSLQQAVAAAAKCLRRLWEIAEALRPSPAWDPKPLDPQTVKQVLNENATSLYDAFAQLEACYHPARGELIAARNAMIAKGGAVRQGLAEAFGCSEMFYLDCAHTAIKDAVKSARYLGNASDALLPAVVKRLQESVAKMGDDSVTLLEQEWRDTEAAKKKSKARGRNRTPNKQTGLTTKQAEAVQIVGECKGDIAAAARRLGKDRKTVKGHYDIAMKKMGKTVVKQATKSLPLDRRGGVNLSDTDNRRLL